ncbi:major histocompatibility complex class I-related gene protein-like isoform X2 [Anolis sagrei]|uniref:major histocompatibility complex class I-related gene protein-like isoform X2 n=1 Tax=Anolis sagrei TaxID=38937 RepID=UPI0035204BB7
MTQAGQAEFPFFPIGRALPRLTQRSLQFGIRFQSAEEAGRSGSPSPPLRPPMGPLLPRLLLLGWAACLLEGTSASSHSLYYQRTYMSQSVPGAPRYVEVGYLDGQPIERYDSKSGKTQALTPWMSHSVGLMENYWEVQSSLAHLNEEGFGHFVVLLERFYHGHIGVEASTCRVNEFSCNDGSCILFGYICDLSQDCKDGSDETPKLCSVDDPHTLQCVDGCELSHDGTEKLYHREAYDGNELKDWDVIWDVYRHRKGFWGLTCIGWLQRHLEFQKKNFTIEAPDVRVIHRPLNESLETLICNVDGFFPKDINAFWLKDGQIVNNENTQVKVFPNADGTYQARLTIQVDPIEAKHYECHVEHTSLKDSLHAGWKWSDSVWRIVGSVFGAVAVGLVVVSGLIFYANKPSVVPSEQPADETAME